MNHKRTTSEAAALAADEDLGASNFGETVAPAATPMPGPWTALSPAAWDKADGQWVVPGVALCGNGELSEANARLIAAAPDLLAALKSLVGHEEPGAMFSERIQKALAAIAKAEGRQP